MFSQVLLMLFVSSQLFHPIATQMKFYIVMNTSTIDLNGPTGPVTKTLDLLAVYQYFGSGTQTAACNVKAEIGQTDAKYVTITPSDFTLTHDIIGGEIHTLTISPSLSPTSAVNVTYLVDCKVAYSNGNTEDFPFKETQLGMTASPNGVNNIITVIYGSADAGSSGDPHFSQIVKDGKKIQKLCYDVTGKCGQNINILSSDRFNFSVSGLLLDDYYMHEIQVVFRGKTIKFGIRTIKFNNGEKIMWQNGNDMEIKRDGFNLFIRDSKIEISLESNHRETFQIVIEKSVNSVVGNYLDVSFPRLTSDYRNFAGIIGEVGNRNFVSQDSIQQFDSENVLFMNGKALKAKPIFRQKDKCLLVNTEDLLFPRKLSEFVHY